MKRINIRLSILSALAVLLMALPCHAQNAQNARKILDKTAATLKSKGGVSATFSASSAKMAPVKGNILVKGKKFHVTTPESTIWYNGKTQWTYLKSSNEVNISTPDVSKQATINPYSFINIYQKGYSMSMSTTNGKYNVHLVSQSASNKIKEMYLVISKSYIPVQIKMLAYNKWTTINISNFKSQSISDSRFVFSSKDFPHAEVVDLR